MFRKTLIVFLTVIVLLGIFNCVHAEEGTIITSLPYTITESGLYYLTEDLMLPAFQEGNIKNGITVSADNVTIDLMGHSISDPVTPGIYGIPSDCGIELKGYNVEIRNGTVKYFDSGGIVYRYNPYGSFGSPFMYREPLIENRIINVRCLDNGGPGISLIYNSLVKNFL